MAILHCWAGPLEVRTICGVIGTVDFHGITDSKLQVKMEGVVCEYSSPSQVSAPNVSATVLVHDNFYYNRNVLL